MHGIFSFNKFNGADAPLHRARSDGAIALDAGFVRSRGVSPQFSLDIGGVCV